MEVAHPNRSRAELPPEMISDILSRLPIESILRCKSVCKTWYSMTTETHFVKLQLSRANDQPPRVILKSLGIVGSIVSRLYLLDTQDCIVREISEGIPLEDVDPIPRGGLHIMSSFHGLLCMAPQKALNPVVIYNPITTEYIVLPKTELQLNFSVTGHQIGFGYDASINKYKAVRIYNFIYYCNGQEILSSRCEIITLGESSWREIVAPYRVELHPCCLGPVFHNGAIHWIISRQYHPSCRAYILSFDITKEVFWKIVFPPTMKKFPENRLLVSTCNLQLTILVGCLALLDYDGQLLHIWVLKPTNRCTGACVLGYYSIRMELPQNVFRSLVYMPSPRNFLLEINGLKLGGYEDLVHYSIAQRNKYLNLQVSGIPGSYAARCFRPSLISIKKALLTH